MKVYAAILAGGKGLRFGADMPKQFLMLGKKPLLRWSLDAFTACGAVEGIVIVCPEEETARVESLLDAPSRAKILAIVLGGKTRQLSSKNAVNAIHSIPCAENDIVIIHDAARPFVSQKIITECIVKAKETGAAGAYIPATDTIAEISGSMIASIPPREKLYYTQTPQAFRAQLIKESHELAEERGETSATDDISLVLAAGYRAAVSEGSPLNIKITTRFDYDAAIQTAEWLEKNEENLTGLSHHGAL